MIVVNGNEYRTLNQKIYVDGKRVTKAYANGELVYPERDDGYILKMVGRVEHSPNHVHEIPSPFLGECQPASSYSFSCAFSIVYRYSSSHVPTINRVNFPALDEETILKSTDDWPNNHDLFLSLNDMFGYAWPDGFDPHPLYGLPEMSGLSVDNLYNVKTIELLFHVSASSIPMHSVKCSPSDIENPSSYGIEPDGGGGKLYDVTCTPQVSSYPGFNGTYHYFINTEDIHYYTGIPYANYLIDEGNFRVYTNRCQSGLFEDRGSTCLLFGRLMPSEIVYDLSGHMLNDDEPVNATKTFTNENLVYTLGIVPFTDMIYRGLEADAPEEMLHPTENDL